jgi:hypothetical protein
LVLSAGADAMYTIDDVDPLVADEVMAWWRDSVCDPALLSVETKRLFNQMLTAGAITLEPNDESHRVGIRFVGPEIADLIKLAPPSGPWAWADGGDIDLLCIVRTGGRLRDLVDEEYYRLKTPHVLIDVAYEHTVALGPLVYPGDTACIGCLVGRVTHFWGDPAPPEQPRVAGNVPLIAGLIDEVVCGAITAKSELVNATVAHDFASHRATRNSLYKLPQCPGCSQGVPISPGRMPLPWIARS